MIIELAAIISLIAAASTDRSTPDFSLNPWIRPLLTELGYVYKPHPALVLLDAESGDLLRRLWLVDILDEEILHVVGHEPQVRKSVAKVRRILIDNGSKEDWESAEVDAWASVWATRYDGGARTAVWVAKTAAEATDRTYNGPARIAAWVAIRNTDRNADRESGGFNAINDILLAVKTRLGIAINRRLAEVLTTTTPGLIILWRGLNTAEPWALALRPTLSDQALAVLDFIDDNSPRFGRRS